MPIHEIPLLEEDAAEGYIAQTCTASLDSVQYVLSLPVSDMGRSRFEWIRLVNGDLILGVFPRGDGYFSVEKLVEKDFYGTN